MSSINPLEQQVELLNHKAFVILNKKVLVVSGEERLSWLNLMFSQRLDDLATGDSVESLWLDAQGRILRDFHIFDDGQNCYLITFAADFDQFVTDLARMIFRSKVSLKVAEEFKVVATFLQPVSDLFWKDPWPATTVDGYRYGVNESKWEYFESLVIDLPQELSEVSELALTPLRIASFRPSGDSEIDERSIPHEYDWLATAVSLKKGCYRGQETVAKVHNLGAPPRRLVFLHLDGSGHLLPEAGVEVVADGVIGKITSVGQHYEMGPIALAIIKRSFSGSQVNVVQVNGEAIAATVENIVPQDAGGVADISSFRKR